MKIFLYLLVIGLVMSFIEQCGFLQNRSFGPKARSAWHYVKITCYCLFAVYALGTVTSNAIASYMMPPPNLPTTSDLPVRILSFLFWGTIGAWIATGKERDPNETDPSLLTSVGRINWLLEQPFSFALLLGERLIKPITWLLIGLSCLVAVALFAFLGGEIERSLESMSTPKAVVLAGVIIAVAILAVKPRR